MPVSLWTVYYASIPVDGDFGGTILRYTRKQRLCETQQIKHRKTVLKLKKTLIECHIVDLDEPGQKIKRSIEPLETFISSYNSKTCEWKNFMEYLSIKNRINSIIAPYYEQEFFRKMKLRAHINKQRTESRLIRNIKWTYGGEDKRPITLIYGDWNEFQMKHIISTPMIGLKRRLHKAFDIINFDEYRTSCLDWRTEEYNEGAIVKTKGGRMKRLHSEHLLVSNMPTQTGFKRSFQNRDRNSVMNIRKLTRHFFAHRRDALGETLRNYHRATDDIVSM